MADSLIYLVAPANLHDQDPQSTVLNVANHAVIPNPISPQFTQRAGQAPTQAPRLPRSGNSLVHVVDNAPSYLLVELAKLVRSGGGLFNRPSQAHFSLQLRNRLSLLLDAGAPVRPPRGSSPPCPQGCAQSSLAGRRPSCARSARPRNQGVARFEGQVDRSWHIAGSPRSMNTCIRYIAFLGPND